MSVPAPVFVLTAAAAAVAVVVIVAAVTIAVAVAIATAVVVAVVVAFVVSVTSMRDPSVKPLSCPCCRPPSPSLSLTPSLLLVDCCLYTPPLSSSP